MTEDDAGAKAHEGIFDIVRPVYTLGSSITESPGPVNGFVFSFLKSE
jgi:hypothetical protein